MRPIDADHLMRLVSCATILSDGFKDVFCRLVRGEPTIDAAKVVRCKECRHFRHYGMTSRLVDGKHVKAGWCYRCTRYDDEYRMLPDDFCSYGERLEDTPCE